MDGDEDVFDRRFQHQYHHQQQKNGNRRRVEYPYHDTPSTSNSLAPPVFDGSDNMTNSNFVILGTILLVTALHFLWPMIARFNILQGRQLGFVDGLLDLVETIKHYKEVAWNHVLHMVMAFSSEDASLHSQESISTIITSNVSNANNEGNIPRKRRFNLNHNFMPELEDISSDETTPLVGLTISTSNPAEIEPAFLDPKDYPNAWLVFHPKLGIIRHDEVATYIESEE